MTTKKKGGRPTNAEMAQKRLDAEVSRRYEEQEAKRAKRFMPDTAGSLIVALALATVGLLTSFIVSYSTLVAVAGWMKLEWAPLDYIVPGFVEMMILFCTYDYIITRSRGNTGLVPLWFMVGFSAIAVIGNGAHSLAAWQATNTMPWYAWIGIGLSALVPLVVVYLSKRLSVLVFAEAVTVRAIKGDK